MLNQQDLEQYLTELIDDKYLTDEYYFDVDEAIQFKTFIEKLQLPDAEKGTLINLMDFQLKIGIEVLAIKRESDDLRRFREVFVTMPRKQAKSFLVACIMLYLFFTDKEQGQQNIIVNNSINQANYIFDMMCQMTKSSKTLMQYCRIVPSRRKIVRTNGSFIQIMSNDPSRLDSFNPFMVIVDETHLDKTQGRSYSMLQQGMGQRDEPLMMSVTTASNGQDIHNLEYEKYQHAIAINQGEIKDDAFYSAIFKADDDSDLEDREQWIKANPAIDLLEGGFRKSEEMERFAEQATKNPAKETEFRRFYMNQHIRLTNENAINMDYWNESGRDDLSFLKGKPAYLGLDLSTRGDFSVATLVIFHEDKYYVIPHLFKPANTLLADGQADNFPYESYATQGYINATDGDYVNFRYVRQKIDELSRQYDIKEVAFDNRASGGIISDLQNDGLVTIDHAQGYFFSPTIADFYDLLFDDRIRHDNNPVMNWMAENTIAKEHHTGRLMFDKSKGKIDGIIAMLMGLTRAIASQNTEEYDVNRAVEEWNNSF